MKLSSRETGLGITTGALLLFGLTFLVVAPKIKVWQERIETQKAQAQRIEVAKRLIRDRARWDKRLADLHVRLSRYPTAMDVTADYLKILERVAKDNHVNLGRRQPQKEKRHGNLYELAIDCSWEGDLEALVRFLFALEQETVTMDVERLTVSMKPGGKDQMRGNFTVMCIYSRSGNPPSEGKSAGSKPERF